ncbi:MAG TPA: DUF4231 domain-containing protein [Actinobacteria bacterium]|jgi:hypothetical protein|nr:DUF4231 domain-containing protein [Actinomycetota bacterium]
MADGSDYREGLRTEMTALIDGLDLSPEQKRMLVGRWLDQLLWMDGRADRARNRHYVLRLTTVIGGIIVPALLTLSVEFIKIPAVRWATFGVSLLVALSAAVEEFFHYGERWRHYRQNAEALKNEGWQFFLLAGGYRRHRSHQTAYPAFTGRVEQILADDVSEYFGDVVPPTEEGRREVIA